MKTSDTYYLTAQMFFAAGIATTDRPSAIICLGLGLMNFVGWLYWTWKEWPVA